MLIAFPIVKNTQWETNDKTSLQMKLGYDRIYDTNLPFKLTNKIESIKKVRKRKFNPTAFAREIGQSSTSEVIN